MARFSLRDAKHIGITDAIIGLCLLMLIVTAVVPSISNDLLFYPPAVFSEPYRLITSAFLHSGFWHFAFNMITLYLVGTQLEQSIGRWRYATLYLVSALSGNLGVLIWAAFTGGWVTAVVGASGAVFGLFGAMLAFIGVGSENFTSVLALVLVNLAYGFLTPGISWQSHVAGFLGGYLLAFIWKTAWRHSRKERPVADAFFACALVAAFGALACGCIYISL